MTDGEKMYRLIKVKDKIRIPPNRFGKGLNKSILEIAQEDYEGIIDEDVGLVLMVTNAKKNGDGHIILGDGAAYYEADLEMLTYKPSIHEIVEGHVSETTEFGAFVSIGAIDGLVHVSQIMDEFLDYDPKHGVFIGKSSKKKLTTSDSVIARIVTVSFKNTIADSKMGLTMRQPFLGKWDWVEKEIENKHKGKENKGEEKVEKAKIEKNERSEKKGKGYQRKR